MKVNGREVGRGIAQNKKQAKYLAAIQALKNLSPTLYEEWKEKKGIVAHPLTLLEDLDSNDSTHSPKLS